MIRRLIVISMLLCVACSKVQGLDNVDTETEESLLTLQEHYLTLCETQVNCPPPYDVGSWWTEYDSVEECLVAYEDNKEDVPAKSDEYYDVWHTGMVWNECIYSLPCEQFWEEMTEGVDGEYCPEEYQEYCDAYERWTGEAFDDCS